MHPDKRLLADAIQPTHPRLSRSIARRFVAALLTLGLLGVFGFVAVQLVASIVESLR